MEEIPAAKFKATALSVLTRVQKTKMPIRITRYGKALVEIVPPSQDLKVKKREFGFLRGKLKIVGDVIAPAFGPTEWDIYRQ